MVWNKNSLNKRRRGKDKGRRERKRKNEKEHHKKISGFPDGKKVKLCKSRPLFIKQKIIDCLKSILAYLSREGTKFEHLLNYASASFRLMLTK